MKKIVRLTESDLVRIVKRVIIESQTDVPSDILSCANEVFSLSDLTKIPTCIELANSVMTDKEIPTDFTKGLKCSTELMSLNKKPTDALNFFTCVLNKVSSASPVMKNNK